MCENKLQSIIGEHKRSGKGGVVSVCSAHPMVLRAAAASAKAYDALLLIESTSNQVDQFGGYTGLTPSEFITQTRDAMLNEGVSEERLVFGGDHLGPNAWQDKPADEAMDLAEELIRQYAQAGFAKIHLDCSMSCADDPVPLDDVTVAKRAARLCVAAEEASKDSPYAGKIVYIIGTEVPVPGGAQEDLDILTPSSADDARQTYRVHQDIFAEHGLEAVWSRVVGLVVQPGVEFDHHQVIAYQPEAAQELVALADEFDHALFEAHSTDYQTPSAFKALVRDHFAILKVGPALTFAYREAVFALSRALREFRPEARVDVEAVLEAVMCAEPSRWQKYYHGNKHELALLRRYSLSDRARYYWPNDAIQAELARLVEAFNEQPLPYGVLHQYLGQALEACHEQGLNPNAEQLIIQHIRLALNPYYQAITEAL
ncbi:class II D-tagatose-bisphosphate aldolase, non-catalytic subunit [Suttonella sp. R2A3]|uniref:class II D-tagatose-bisphosphate aldolase, non-catalytic subunit n=1 Tax=Suttonella sp. R2A3 TaxID=2908648 RepID=UPI001F181E57|nr:class II D-tagatose-bisphosphate aldolase, non-catalytic subunit [Suttonella sp. R2A3]UJF24060.1 class II D-tagatose-bisphosphate aldolase, non-catalytic subunit [Suttonella sp. R2A3]